MRILTTYLIRAHVGPFLFALSTLTGLLFLNAVAQRLENLAGKGLTWDVIREFLVLSLPHTVALTLPMAVLVAVLYAFSELTANNEITAMKAGGVRPQRVMVPLLGLGVIIGGVMLLFNDRVLPQSNHRLKNLLLDINRKSPTFVLREQVVNRIPVGREGDVFYLTAATIDNQTNEMASVAIYDVSDPMNHRTTYADRGVMAFNEARTDLYLTLFDGVILETGEEPPAGFRRTGFEREVLVLRGVGNEMERRAGGTERSDREMTLAMLDSAATDRAQRLDSVRAVTALQAKQTVLHALGRDSAARALSGEAARYDLRRPVTRLGSGPLDDRPRPEGVEADVAERSGVPAGERADRAGGQEAAGNAGGAQPRPRVPGRRPLNADPRELDEDATLLGLDDLTQQARIRANTNWAVANSHRDRVNNYRVEIHKKYTLAFACVVFVLVGGPLAVRFPRGGLGLVIAASSGIFAVYWAGLIGGENLADGGVAPAGVTMWIPNLVFTAVGLWLFLTMGRESATSRGGGWDDALWNLRKRIAAPFTRRRGPERSRAVPRTGDARP